MRLAFTDAGEPIDVGPDAIRDDDAFADLRTQIDEYFAGTRRRFDLELRPQGSAFQRQVWDHLVTIGYGTTQSYGQVAAAIGNPRSSRAVGLANGQNPIAIVVPCHRVIGADGKLTGYAGGMERKRHLLDLERGTPTLG